MSAGHDSFLILNNLKQHRCNPKKGVSLPNILNFKLEDLKRFVDNIQKDTVLQEKLRNTKKIEEVISIATDYGYSLNLDPEPRKLTVEEQQIIEKATLINIEILLSNQLINSRFNHIFRSLLTCLRATQVFTSPIYYLTGFHKKNA